MVKSITPEWHAWYDMKRRCYNPKSSIYQYYGARGIKVCDRWLDSFENFLQDMGKRPSVKHSLDRKDNKGNYEPGNCRWATKTEQVTNRRILKNNKTGVEGVSRSWREGKFRARLSINGRQLYLGSFDTIEEAHARILQYEQS